MLIGARTGPIDLINRVVCVFVLRGGVADMRLLCGGSADAPDTIRGMDGRAGGNAGCICSL